MLQITNRLTIHKFLIRNSAFWFSGNRSGASRVSFRQFLETDDWGTTSLCSRLCCFPIQEETPILHEFQDIFSEGGNMWNDLLNFFFRAWLFYLSFYRVFAHPALFISLHLLFCLISLFSCTLMVSSDSRTFTIRWKSIKLPLLARKRHLPVTFFNHAAWIQGLLLIGLLIGLSC